MMWIDGGEGKMAGEGRICRGKVMRREGFDGALTSELVRRKGIAIG